MCLKILATLVLPLQLMAQETTTDSDFTTTDEPLVPCNSQHDCFHSLGRGFSCNGSVCLHCTECCNMYPPCVNCGCHLWLSDQDVKLVAQAVLGVAVVITFIALVCLLWKTCSRRRFRARPALSRGRESSPDYMDDSASLNSAQVFVVERLRDRPPRYEEASRDPAIEKPPAYHQVVSADGTDGNEAPPPYQATVVVDGVPITLVGANLTSRNFLAPPSYSEQISTVPVHQTGAQPIPPRTPPAQRLRRIVHKLVVMRRFGASDTPPPSLTAASTAPDATKERQTAQDSIAVAQVIHHHLENNNSNVNNQQDNHPNNSHGVDNRAFTAEQENDIDL